MSDSAFDIAAAELAALCPSVLTADILNLVFQVVGSPKFQSLLERSDCDISRLSLEETPTAANVPTENDSSAKTDAELDLNELRAEMDRIRELIKQKRLDVKQNRCSPSSGSAYIKSVQTRIRSLLRRANALVLAPGRVRVTLPTEILIYICSLAYEPRQRMRSLAAGHCKTATGDLWDQICCMAIPDELSFAVRNSRHNTRTWRELTDDVRRALDASNTSKLHIFVNDPKRARDSIFTSTLMPLALEYQHRWTKLTICTTTASDTAATLKQCSNVLPSLQTLNIVELQDDRMPSNFELWGPFDDLPSSPRIQSAYSPLSFIPPCRPLYSNLIYLTLQVFLEKSDIGELRSAFHGLDSLRTLKILRPYGFTRSFETSPDHEVLPNPDVLPNLKNLIMESNCVSLGYVKCILQSIPSKGLQKIVADFCELGRKIGSRERLATIIKKAIELIELVDTRYPNLSHISMVAGKQYGYHPKGRREHWVVRGLIKFLSKPTSKDQWILPRLTKLTLPFGKSMMSNLVHLVRKREENMSTLSLDVLEFRQQRELLDYGALEEISAYVHDVVILRSAI